MTRRSSDIARQLRRDVEERLERARLERAQWPWRPVLSLWVDALVSWEDGEPALFSPRALERLQ